MKGHASPSELRRRAVDRLLALLPAPTERELRPLLDPRVPDPEGVVLTLLYEEERRSAVARLGVEGDGEAGSAAALLRRLLPISTFDEARRIARDAWLRGRTDWLRFALGRMPGTTPPRELLPLHPEVVYAGEGFRDWHDFLWPGRDPPAAGAGARYWSRAAAIAFVQSRGLRSQNEWQAFSRGDLAEFVGTRPRGIPGNPNKAYESYPGMKVWLGTPHDRPAAPGHLRYPAARQLVWSLGLSSGAEWRDWVRGGSGRAYERPGNLPALPEVVYAECWRGMRSWLGLPGGPAPTRRGWLPFEEARAFARSLGLSDVRDWREWRRGERPDLPPPPPEVPANPESVYEGCGFRGFGDWLGTHRVGSRMHGWRPFEEARELARSLHLSGAEEWYAWTAGELVGKPPRPPDVPVLPYRSYEGRGWRGWGDFLGTGNVAHVGREFRGFAAAREFARSLRLTSAREWQALCRSDDPDRPLPPDIPAGPDTYYRDHGGEWTDWGDFLGTGNVHCSKREYRSYEEAREFARRLEVSSSEWRLLCRGELPGKVLPPDIPRDPSVHYRGRGWIDWPDFLGSAGRAPKRRRRWMPFAEARHLVRKQRFRRKADYRAWLDGDGPELDPPPTNLPLDPPSTYGKSGFRGWWDFLGLTRAEQIRRRFRSFEEARRFARSLRLPGVRAWNEWARGRRPGPARPPDIPGKPDATYRDEGWAGWPDFLGIG